MTEDEYINPIDFLPATAHDYADWLFAYLDAGGKPTHFYPYTFPKRNFVIARRDVYIYPRHGAESVNILVPGGVNATIIGLGHCNVYCLPAPQQGWFRGGKHASPPEHLGGVVPVYSDEVFMQREDLHVGMLREQERSRQTERHRERAMQRHDPRLSSTKK